MKKLLTLLISLLLLTTLTGCGSKINTVEKEVNTKDGKYANKTVILHTNDVHGAVEGYSYINPLKKAYEDEGATVLLMDAGDYISGGIYVNASEGESAITLMNQVGYDYVGLGNHEFEYGQEHLNDLLSKGTFKVLCSNVFKDDKTIYDSEVVIKIGNLKIGVFALETPEVLTKTNPEGNRGLTIPSYGEMYEIAQKEIEKLKKESDLIICLSHLGIDDESTGNRSYDLYYNAPGIDFIIDAHSHSVMTEGDNKEPIQSTGTKFENIGVIVIDNETKKIESNELIPTEGLEQDTDVLATAQNVIQTVDAEYDKVIAKTLVDLNGVKENVRTKETNLGDLATDAMLWAFKNENKVDVDDDHIVVIQNGGGIRTSIPTGDITRKQTFEVFPFGNTISVNYCTGYELLETLEASTFSTPEAAGGFPQIAGMKIVIDTTKKYDQGELYPESTYYGPNSIQRVTILEVNGKPFNLDDTYAVIDNDFVSAGGDTYYALRAGRLTGNAYDTPITLDSALANYIMYELGGVVGEEYKEPQGRISIIK